MTINNEYLSLSRNDLQNARLGEESKQVTDDKNTSDEKRGGSLRFDGDNTSVGISPRLTNGSEFNIPDLEDMPPVLARPGRIASLYEQVTKDSNAFVQEEKTIKINETKAEKDAKEMFSFASASETDSEETAAEHAAKTGRRRCIAPDAAHQARELPILTSKRYSFRHQRHVQALCIR